MSDVQSVEVEVRDSPNQKDPELIYN